MNFSKIYKIVQHFQLFVPYCRGNAALSGILCFIFASFSLAQTNHRPLILNSQVGEITNRSEQSHTEKQNKEYNTTNITIRGDTTYTGSILYATDSVLVIWKSSETYNIDKLNELAMQLPYYDIERIVIKKKSYFWSGLGYGFLIGGGLGAIIGLAADEEDDLFTPGSSALMSGFALGACGALIGVVSGALVGIDDDYLIEGNAEAYKSVVSNLKKNANFPTAPPQELQMLQSHKIEVSPTSVEPALQMSKPSPKSSAGRFHFAVGGAWVLTAANNSIIDAFNSSGFGGSKQNWLFGGTIEYPMDESAPLAWDFGAEYNLTHHFRLGLALSKIPQQRIKGIDMEYEYARGTLYSLLVEYVPTPVAPLLISRFEFAIGAGLGYNTLSVDGTLSALRGSAVYARPVSFAFRESSIGAHLRGSIDYYASRNFSLQFKSEARFISSVDVPAISHINPNNNEVKTLKQHSVNFSAVTFSLGLRFHF